MQKKEIAATHGNGKDAHSCDTSSKAQNQGGLLKMPRIRHSYNYRANNRGTGPRPKPEMAASQQ